MTEIEIIKATERLKVGQKKTVGDKVAEILIQQGIAKSCSNENVSNKKSDPTAETKPKAEKKAKAKASKKS